MNIDEDRKLLNWVSKIGPSKWAICAHSIVGRSGKQCRERYYNALCPNIKRGGWTPEEDFLLFRMYEENGSQWSKIAKSFQGRTENSLKNRFYSTLRKIETERKKEKITKWICMRVWTF